MKTILASVAFLAFAAAPALAGGGGCASMTTAMSKKPVVEQLASVAPALLTTVDGRVVGPV